MKHRPIRGKNLEHVAAYNGLYRKLGPWWWPWWPLRESDAKLRGRLLRHFEQPGACGGFAPNQEGKP